MKDYAAARERCAPPPVVHVVPRKEDLGAAPLAGSVAVVLDSLFATTTIVTALDAGASVVIPAEDPDEARRAAEGLAPGSFHIAGEYQLAPIPGFATPMPLELSERPDFAGKPLIYSTTNGTVALRRSRAARAVYAAALRNRAATLGHVQRHHAAAPVVIVCSGSSGSLNLEDFYAAGAFVDLLVKLRGLDPARHLADTALAALATYRGGTPAATLDASRVGRICTAAGSGSEVRHAAEVDVSPLVALLKDDKVVRA